MLWSFLVWARAIHIKRILINHEISRARDCALSVLTQTLTVSHTRTRSSAPARGGAFTFLQSSLHSRFVIVFSGESIFYLQRKKVA